MSTETFGIREADPHVAGILDIVHQRTGVDFSNYRPAMVLRRIANRMISVGAASIEHYRELLGTNDGEAHALLERVAIKVSRFYRNPATFDVLRHRVIPRLAMVRCGRPLRIWSIGCARGEEAYSLAMLLDEADIDATVDATDIEPRALTEARIGAYSKESVTDLPGDLLARYFHSTVNNAQLRYRIGDTLRHRVRFSHHDITRGAPAPAESAFDLITCRNVLIYLKPEMHAAVFDSIAQALRPGGYLCLGEAEWLCPSVEPRFTTFHAEGRIFTLREERRDS